MEAENGKRGRPKGYFFLTPVWGEAYTRMFVETAIPGQLSPGNLPVFKDSPHSQYVIFTTPEDAQTIRSAPIFRRLSETIKVTIEYINEAIHLPHDMMSACHKRGIVLADAADAAALFLNPDLVFADGSFRTVRRLAEQGHDVILVPGIRTLKQGVVRVLHADFKAGETIVAPPRELMQIALNNLHPLADSSWWEEGESDLIPANLYWRAGREGIVARCFHLHPLMVYPQRKGAVFFGTVDDDYFVAACPDARYDHIVEDSDELLAIELSDPGRVFLTGFRKASIDDTIVWAEQFTHGRHRMFFDAVVRMHTGMRDAQAWAEAARKAEDVAEAVKARLRLSTWRLFLGNSPALPRRLIRWSRDYELQKANLPQSQPALLPVKRTTFSWLVGLKHHAMSFRRSSRAFPPGAPYSRLGGMLLAIPSALLLLYYRLVRKLAGSYSAVKSCIYGPPWRPYPWTWRYRYVTQLRRDMLASLDSGEENTLVIAYDDQKSLAIHCLGHKAQAGLFVHGSDGIQLIDKKSSQILSDAHYRTVVIERSLPQARQLDPAMREIARILHPEGKLIMLVNRIAFPADRLEYEICATTSAVAGLLAPEFKVLSHRKQGGVAPGLLYYMMHWMKLQMSHLHIPFIFMALFSSVMIPINIMLALAGNLLALLLDAVDTTGRYYVSSITTAIKAEPTP